MNGRAIEDWDGLLDVVEALPLGSTVNLASRLESGVAKPGQIVIGPSTAALVGQEQLRQMEGFMLKGIEQEVRPYEVLWVQEGPTAVMG